MCGIAGLFFRSEEAARAPEAERRVQAMATLLAHRGPDDEGYLRTGTAVLGHRRLSILDLSERGRQPMTAAGGRLAIVYNGEIYNFVELREELRAAGHAFLTGTDTEVLLAAYERWGEDCLPRLNGMFAFAIHDDRTGRLFCARDRLGIKPFYYAVLPEGTLAFASEPKAFRALPLWPPEPDPIAVREYLVTGRVDFSDRSFFSGIRSLPAAHSFTVSPGEAPRPRRWWTAADLEPRAVPDRDVLLAEARETLLDAVRVRLRSDVPVGTCLSGGIDSSTVVGMVAELLGSGGEQHTFSACFTDEGIDERPFMDRVIERTGAVPHRVFPTGEEWIEDLPRLVAAQDEPFGSTSIYVQNRVFALARENGVIVTLDGQGADELMAGYDAHHGSLVADLFGRGLLLTALREARALGRLRGRSALGLLAAGRKRAKRIRGRGRRAPDWVAADLLRPEFEPPPAEPERSRGGLLQDHLWDDLTRSVLPALLRYADRNAMAHSVEARFPFLDYRFVELARALPPAELIRGGRTKALLRDLAEPFIPPEVRARTDKIAFKPPEARWFKGPPGDRLESALDEGRDTLGRYIRIDRLKESWRSFRAGESGFRTGFFRALNLHLWLAGLRPADGQSAS